MDALALIAVGLVAGAVTAISPCVLPVLPVVLGGSAGGGRLRPVGIVLGLVVAFVSFTLAAASALRAVGLDAGTVRDAAIVVLALFGAALLLPVAGRAVEAALAPVGRLGERIARGAARGRGLPGGVVLGAALGLAWTPCAGPILGAVTAAVASGRSGAEAGLVLTAYAIGAAAPLLAIGWLGRRAVGRLGSASRYARPGLGLAMIAVAGAMLAGLDTRLVAATTGDGYVQALQSLERSGGLAAPLAHLRGYAAATPTPTAVGGGLPDLGPAPALVGITGWLNTPGDRPLPLSALRGRVVLVDFWTYSCVNCVRTIPHLRALQRAYAPRGLTILGVHSPEFAFEAEPGNVADAVRRLGVTWPVALDPGLATFTAFRNAYWPAEYLIDRTGRIRNLSIGEGDYGREEALVRRLLGLRGPGIVARSVPDLTPDNPSITPETYLGASRVQRLASPERVVWGVPTRFTGPPRLRRDDLALVGTWSITGERAVAVSRVAIRFHVRARRVYLVLDSPGRRRVGRVLLDGRPVTRRDAGADVGPDGRLVVRASRLYRLVSVPGPLRDHQLRVDLPPGVGAYAFTFG